MKSAARMFLGLSLLGVSAVNAAIVVTKTQKLEARITAQDEKSVTLTGETGNVLIVPRENILEIYDDKGELVWQEEGLKQRRLQPMAKQQPFFAPKSILLDLYISTSTGGFYSEEKKLMDSLGIYVSYSDGSIQTATNTFLGFGAGISYQSYENMRWSNLFSYMYRATMLRTSAGDGRTYENKSLASEVTTTLHTLLLGKEVHFYPSDGGSSFDLVGQVGYELGNYYPLATYSAARTQLSPVPPQYLGSTKILIHGPTARLGAGATFRGSNFQFRLHAYYQMAYLFTAEKIWTAVDKNVLVHDFYAAASVGYGW